QIVEMGPVQEIFSSPQHSYTRGLISVAPTLSTDRSRPLQTIEKAARTAAPAPLRLISAGHWARVPQ
ncbi:MAG: ABC transporter ATP-binding protein, partial [Candidatus Angelobacter sp.]